MKSRSCAVLTAIFLANVGLSTSSQADDIRAVEYINGALFLNQGWSGRHREKREEFYYTSQGSQLIPYSWFFELNRANSSQRFFDPEAGGLSRYGYLVDPLEHEKNPDGLPLGFVKDTGRKGLEDDECEFVGMTCAACHTAIFQHQGKEIYIDGGPTTANMYEFLKDLRAAIASTAGDATRLQVFQERLEKRGENRAACMPKLKESLEENASHLAKLINPKGHPEDAADWGPARLDAVGIIVNQLHIHLGIEQNLGRVDAPVSYPFLWDTHQHNQVQWNGVSRMPLVRNITEVLGVFANFGPDGEALEDNGLPKKIVSTIRIKGITHIEDQMASLRSPLWPEDLFNDRIDEEKRAKGEELFDDHCAHCHADVPRDSWIPNITAEMTTLLEIGTDTNAANNFASRPILGTKIEGAENGVNCLVEGEEPSWWARFKGNFIPSVSHPSPYDTPPAERLLQALIPKFFGLRGFLAVAGEAIRAAFLPNTNANRCAYKGRPLDGIWATAPYLHNGSVPNLNELLKPVGQRVKKFCVSTRPTFDPVNVGLEVKTTCDGQMLDTSKPGNSNAGHDYPFVIPGTPPETRPYTDEERAALVEYQKSL